MSSSLLHQDREIFLLFSNSKGKKSFSPSNTLKSSFSEKHVTNNEIIILASWILRQLCVKQKSSINCLKSISTVVFPFFYLTLRFTISDKHCLFPCLINAGTFFMSTIFLSTI